MAEREQKNIRVLHIITRLIKGGAQENTLLTVVNLDEVRYRTILVSGPSIGPEGEIESRARRLGVDLTVIPDLIREISPLADLKALYKLYCFIKRGKYDIVHTHSSKAGILGRIAARMAGVRSIIHTPHGSIFNPDASIPSVSGRAKLGFLLYVEKAAARITRMIITLTDAEAKEYIELGIADNRKLTTIHSGIVLSRFTDVEVNIINKRKKLGIPVDSTVIITVARLTSEKGHSYLVEAAKRIMEISTDKLWFVFTGDGDLRSELGKEVHELGLNDAVLFLGLRDDVPELLAVSDIFVLPSLYEAQGRVIVEAMAAELPVVATKVGGVPDVVVDGKTGILVPAADSQALAEAILSLIIDKKKAKQMGQAGRKRVDPEFSVEAMVEKIDDLYCKLIGINDARSPEVRPLQL